ncbi:MAG: histidine kinase [Roseivirga sp.]|nr:histidine kinase [Roseivirga sp.]
MNLRPKQVQTILLHLSIWVLLLIIRFFVLDLRFADRLLLLDFSLYAAYFYINAYLLAPRLFSTKKIQFVLINLLFIALLASIEAYATVVVFGETITVAAPGERAISYTVRNSFSLQFTAALYLNCYVFLASFAYGAHRSSMKHEEEKEEVMTRKLSNKLSRLRSQVNPQLLSFLLKKINQSLADSPQEKAAETIEDLSGLMRYMIYRKGDKKSSLVQELEKTYCLIQLLSNGQSMTRILLPPINQMRELLIEPTILISMVETAHMINQDGYATEISKITLNEKKLHISMPIKERLAGGNDNMFAKLNERLEVAYPQAHNLSIDAEKREMKLILQLI